MLARTAAPPTARWWQRLGRGIASAARRTVVRLKQLGVPLPGSSHAGVVYDVYPTGGPWWNRFRSETGADTNSIVQAVAGWVARTFPEAPLRVYDRQPGGDEVVFAHDLERLVEAPNPFYGGPQLWAATILDYLLTGNAYWLKVRDGRGRVRELWWLPSCYLEPRWDAETDYISYYEYRPNGEARRLEQADVCHFRYGLDADNPRKGKSPLAYVLAEVLTDAEATRYTQVILKNLGVPGVILSPEETQILTDDELEAMKAKFAERFTGEHRGEPLVLTSKTRVDVLSFSPEQLNLRELRKIPEERISAVVGLPAIVAGLGAGLDRSTFANFKEAREAAYESLIIPMQRAIASDVSLQLLPDFSAAPGRQQCGFDTANVRVLQEDQDQLVARLVAAVEGGLITPNEGRAKLGLPEADDDSADLRLRKIALKVVEPERPEPQAPPPALVAPPAGAPEGLPVTSGDADETAATERAEAALEARTAAADAEAAKTLPWRVAGWMNGSAVGAAERGD